MSMDNDDLITDYLSGNCTPEQEVQLANLLKSDPDFKNKIKEMASTRSLAMSSGFANQKQRNLTYLRGVISTVPSPNTVRFSIRKLLQYAAVLILVVATNVAIYHLVTNKLQKGLDATITTSVPYGAVSKIILPDSSEVWLNAGSTLSYPTGFGITNRSVNLEGEAHFSVKKNNSLPFTVQTDHLNVNVTGTQFNVKAYPEEIITTIELTEGKVLLNLPDQPAGEVIKMHPNEKVIVNNQHHSFQKEVLNPTRSSGWIDGDIEFTDESFASIALMLERKYDVKIKIESAILLGERFTGSFTRDYTLERILQELDFDHKYQFFYSVDTVTIKNKKH